MKTIKSLDALNDFLEKLEEEKQDLENKIELLEQEKDFKRWEWMKHILIKKNEFRCNLPCPRIEVQVSGDEYGSRWLAGIVYPDYADFENNTFLPLFWTNTSRGLMDLELPNRMEYQIYSYSRIFNLRIFLTIEERCGVKELFIKPEFIKNMEIFESKNVID